MKARVRGSEGGDPESAVSLWAALCCFPSGIPSSSSIIGSSIIGKRCARFGLWERVRVWERVPWGALVLVNGSGLSGPDTLRRMVSCPVFPLVMFAVRILPSCTAALCRWVTQILPELRGGVQPTVIWHFCARCQRAVGSPPRVYLYWNPTLFR